MKQLQKFAQYLFVAVIAVGVASCKKDKEPSLPDPEPKLLSFGFYAEDNEDVLFRDYVVSDVTGATVQIDLPKDADRRNLVARYTTTDNATVTVSGALQQSGTTKVNFTAPVDYIVTEGNINARYTVTVGNLPDYVWTKVGVYTDAAITAYTMSVNPKTAIPHFAYVLSNSDTDLRKGYAVKYEDNVWSALGGALTEGRSGTDIHTAFDKDGKLYVTYEDYATTPAQSPIVKTYNGSAWVNVGPNPVFPARVTYTSLGINPDNNQPFLVNYIEDRNYHLPRRAMTTSYFNGSTWTINNQITGRPETLTGGISKNKTVGDTFYLLVLNQTNPSTYSVYTYKQGVWTTIVDQLLEEGASGVNIRDIDMDVDDDGNIYIMASDNATGSYKPRVKKYDAQSKTWSQIGSPIEVDQTNTRYFSMAIAPNGIIHIVYRDEQKNPVVVSFDSETQNWGTAKVLEAVETADDFMYLEFANDGTGYLSFISDSNDQINVYKYDLPAGN